MRQLFAALFCVVVFAPASHLLGEQAPQPPVDVSRLAGTWQLDTSGNASAPAETRVITVSPEGLRIETHRPEDARPPVITYRFDGRDTVNAFGSGKATSRLTREGGAIVTETIYEIRNAPITVRETLSVNPANTELTVVAVLRVEHGYEGPLAGGESKSPNVSNATMVFRRKP
jgi:hypothetical protein